MKKRILSFFMACFLLLSLVFPGMCVFAEEVMDEEVKQLPSVAEKADVLSEEKMNTLAEKENNDNEKMAEEDENADQNNNDDSENAELMVKDDAASVPVVDETQTDNCDFTALFSAKLFVAENVSAGLEGSVSVMFKPLSCTGTVYLPGSADPGLLFLSWNDETIVLSGQGTKYKSGFAPIAPAGEEITYRVTRGKLSANISIKTVQGSSDVQGMFLSLDESLGSIDAMNNDPEHETSCYGSVTFDGESYPYMSMKGRGNATWDFEKKPYNMTFYKKGDYDKKQKTELIPGVEAKKWSLLANYLDTSLIRNKVGLDLASKLGIGLDSRFVDLWMNGEYLGNYLLTPKNDYQSPDGGYVLENDNYISKDDPQFSLPGMREPADIDGFHNLMTIKDIGDDAVDAGENAETIEAHFLKAWNALRNYDSEEYQEYFDIDSWAKQYLMYEVTKTYDVFSGSLLMHRDGLTENDKITAGPAWDMDNSFGRTIIKLLSGVTMYNQLTAEGWYVDSVGLVACKDPVSLLQEFSKHPSFKQRMSEIYNDYRSAFEEILGDIDTQKGVLGRSAYMDYARWGNLRLSIYYTPVAVEFGSGKYKVNYEATKSWDNYVNNMYTYVTKRVQYMSDKLCVAYPEGKIVGQTELQSGDNLELTVALTDGRDKNAFLWQKKVNEEWCDIDGAIGSVLKMPVTEADNDTEYRCIVRNFGEKILMTHGKAANASAKTELDSVSIKVTAKERSQEQKSDIIPGKDAGDSNHTNNIFRSVTVFVTNLFKKIKSLF